MSDDTEECSECCTPNDGTWPTGSDVCNACWDVWELEEAERNMWEAMDTDD